MESIRDQERVEYRNPLDFQEGSHNYRGEQEIKQLIGK